MATSKSEVAIRRRRRWQELLGRWQASGLSQAAFCRRHGVPVWKMAWWKKRLGARRSIPAVAFVPVKVVPTAVGPERLELVLSCGRRLRFPADMAPSKLAAIVAALEAAAPSRVEGSAC